MINIDASATGMSEIPGVTAGQQPSPSPQLERQHGLNNTDSARSRARITKQIPPKRGKPGDDPKAGNVGVDSRHWGDSANG